MADNYTALKSSQKKRYISEETFNSLDLSQVPVGSEYEVVSPIKKGDLSAEINNSLNKADNALQNPTNQTTGSNGDVLVKTTSGSEWKSISTPTVVQGTGQSTTDVMSQKAVTDELSGKVSKFTNTSSYDRVYAQNSAGEETGVNIDGGVSDYSLIRRSATGTAKVAKGVADDDIANIANLKENVDALQAKLNENIVKDPSKTYLIVNGNVQSTVDLGPNVVYDVDWGDGIVQTSQTTKLSHTYTDGVTYHLITITSTSEYCKNLFAGITSLIKIIVGTSTPLFLNNEYVAFDGDTNLEEIDLSHCSNSVISDTTLDLSTTKVNKLILPKNLDSTPAQSSGWLIANLIEELIIPTTLATTFVLNGKGYLKNLKKLYLPRTESILTLSGSYASIPDNCKVIVPKSLISAYKSAAGWSMIADKIVYEVDSSDIPDMSNVAYTNKSNTFEGQQIFEYIAMSDNSGNCSLSPRSLSFNSGKTTYSESKITNIDTSTGSPVFCDFNFPSKSGTLALTSDVDAKSSFSVEVW